MYPGFDKASKYLGAGLCGHTAGTGPASAACLKRYYRCAKMLGAAPCCRSAGRGEELSPQGIPGGCQTLHVPPPEIYWLSSDGLAHGEVGTASGHEFPDLKWQALASGYSKPAATSSTVPATAQQQSLSGVTPRSRVVSIATQNFTAVSPARVTESLLMNSPNHVIKSLLMSPLPCGGRNRSWLPSLSSHSALLAASSDTVFLPSYYTAPTQHVCSIMQHQNPPEFTRLQTWQQCSDLSLGCISTMGAAPSRAGSPWVSMRC